MKKQGIDKEEIGREEFLEHAWAWRRKSTAARSSASSRRWVHPLTGTESDSPWTRDVPRQLRKYL